MKKQNDKFIDLMNDINNKQNPAQVMQDVVELFAFLIEKPTEIDERCNLVLQLCEKAKKGETTIKELCQTAKGE